MDVREDSRGQDRRTRMVEEQLRGADRGHLYKNVLNDSPVMKQSWHRKSCIKKNRKENKLVSLGSTGLV